MFRPTKMLFAAAFAASALVAPAHADNTEWAGFTCGFSSTNDPTGAVQQNPDVQMGEADGGPWTSFDLLADDGSGASAHPGGADITITCAIQVNNPMAGGTPAASVSGTGNGVAYAVGQITYTATATDNVYLCTYVTMSHGNTVENYVFDEDDDPSNGNQCALAISAGA